RTVAEVETTGQLAPGALALRRVAAEVVRKARDLGPVVVLEIEGGAVVVEEDGRAHALTALRLATLSRSRRGRLPPSRRRRAWRRPRGARPGAWPRGGHGPSSGCRSCRRLSRWRQIRRPR